jgi:uronate dehydrogenase
MLATWMSFDDFEALIDRVFTAPLLGCPIIYGASNNDRGLWDNSAAAFLGWRPKDNAETFRAEIDAAMPIPPRDDAASLYQGGHFVREPIFPED